MHSGGDVLNRTHLGVILHLPSKRESDRCHHRLQFYRNGDPTNTGRARHGACHFSKRPVCLDRLKLATTSRTDEGVTFGNYLEAEGVEDHGVDGGHVEVQRRDAQLVQAGDELEELLGAPPREHLEARVAFHHGHLDVRNRRRPAAL